MKLSAASGSVAPAPRPAWWWTVAVAAAGAVLVFWLPWRVPVRTGIESDSSFFGFSNGAAIAGVGLTLLTLLALRLARRDGAEFLADIVRPPDRATAAETAALVLGIGATAVVVGGWWSLLPNAFFGESTYFLTRLDMLQYGLRPYHDFDFGYGPSLLLVPAALHWGSGRLLAMDSAYVFTVVVHSALGLMAASAILRRVTGNARLRRTILSSMVLLAVINISLGVIYSLLRFVYPAWAALVFHEAQRRHRPWVGWATAFLLPFDGLQISPEVGVATTAAVFVGLVFQARDGRADLLPRAVAVLAAPLTFLTIFGAESMAMLVRFGSGTLNFPILPAPFIVALLGLACFLLPALGSAAIRGGGQAAPATASLAVALGMLLPVALGRCDPGHVLANGLVLTAVAVVAACSRCGAATRRLVSLAATVMFVTALASHCVSIGRPVLTALQTRRFYDREADRLGAGDAAVLGTISTVGTPPDFGWSKRPPFDPSLLELARFDAIATPLGSSEDIDRLLKLSGRYVPLRNVPPFAGYGDRASAREIAADAMRSEYVLLPQPELPEEAVRLAERKSRYIRVLFALPPIALRPVNEPFSGRAEVQRIIRMEYETVQAFPPYEILRRRTGPAAGFPATQPGKTAGEAAGGRPM